MNRFGPHNQTNRVHNWPDAVRAMQPESWFKFMDDVAMSRDAKAANPNIKVVGRFHRDSMQQFSLDGLETRQRARDFIGTWLNDSFLEVAQHIDAIEDFNEYWAVSHTKEETRARVLWIEILLSVWEDEVLPQARYSHLARIKWCLGNAAVGNDMPWQVAHLAVNAQSGPHYLGYHGYVSVVSKDYVAQTSTVESASSNGVLYAPPFRENFRDGALPYYVSTYLPIHDGPDGHVGIEAAGLVDQITPGERSPQEFEWGSGRILAIDNLVYNPRGLYPKYIITEGGLVRDANGRGWLQPNDGWKHENVINGSLDEYERLMREVSDLYSDWNSRNNNRARGYVFFTSGIGDWPGFLLKGGELIEMMKRTAAFPADQPQQNPSPDPDPDPLPEPGFKVIGLDISHHQRSFDAPIAYEAGNRFVYIKATDGWVIDPELSEPRLDPTHSAFTEAAIDANLLVGSYHFYQPNISSAEQALLFLDALNNVGEQNLPPALDLEKARDISVSQFQLDVYEWLQIVEDQTGQIPCLYTSVSFYNEWLNDPRFDRYPLWIANWREKSQQPYLPSRRSSYLLWQWTSEGNGGANGVQSSTVDLDRFNASSVAEFYERFGTNWMKESESGTTYELAPIREQYERRVHVIHPIATDEQSRAIYEYAKERKETITWSYDDAGATPCKNNTAFLWLTSDEEIGIYDEWFTRYYPNTTVVHPHFEFALSLPLVSTPAEPAPEPNGFEPWWEKVSARLRRALGLLS